MTILVGIDVTIANTPPRSGVGGHIASLLERLERHAPSDMQFRLFYAATDAQATERANRQLPSSSRMRAVRVPFFNWLRGAHQLHWRMVFPLAIKRERCSVFHGPAHVLPRVAGLPTVVTIHDLAFFEHDLYTPSFTKSLRDEVSRSIAAATSVIAVSANTRSDIARLTRRSTGVDVVYNGVRQPNDWQPAGPGEDRTLLDGKGITRRFVLYVGDFNARKNLAYLIESFARLLRVMPPLDVQLVLAGASATAAGDFKRQAAAAGIDDANLVITGRVSDELLMVLYRNASAFALCSLTEGFSMTMVEAMGFGVPVVAADVGAIREVAGNAAELVPLGQPELMAEALARVLTPGPRCEELKRLGPERARAFTWDAAARQTISVYESTASKRISPARTVNAH